MVFCCVPSCNVDSWTCDPSITFHDFPNNPDLTAKWIQQINTALETRQSPMWFPRGKPVICSNHFLQTDFKEDSDTLKPRCIPTVFGHKYISFSENANDKKVAVKETNKSPLIVKVLGQSDNGLVISDVFSTAPDAQNLLNESTETFSAVSSHSKTPTNPNGGKGSLISAFQSKKHGLGAKLNQSLKSLLKPSAKTSAGTILNRSPGNSIYTGKSPNVGILTNRLPGNVAKPNMAQNNAIIVNRPSNSFKSNIKTPSGGSVLIKSPGIPKISLQTKNTIHKRNIPKKGNTNNELIEIGPNTFLKINPDIIKVNKKQTPSGNTVLQFVMDQKMANSQAAHLLPQLLQCSTASSPVTQSSTVGESFESGTPDSGTKKTPDSTEKNEPVVQHVLGHLVETHVCKDTCTEMEDEDDVAILDDENDDKMDTTTPNGINTSAASSESNVPSTSGASKNNKPNITTGKTVPNFLNKAPVLFTTSIPLSHTLMDRPKFAMQLKQKSRQIAALKFKIASLTKKVEELEDRCIVQERQLSYSFIKRLKTIRKNASKNDACATYILEQIRCYAGKNKMRWSDSTLSQCAVWCRKAPYAYEYFKKADFFKLPCLGTVKRFIKKHPELKFVNKSNPSNPDDDESSSDFDFDESDEDQGNSDAEKAESAVHCETILIECNDSSDLMENHQNQSENHTNQPASGNPTGSDSSQQETNQQNSGDASVNKDAEKTGKHIEVNTFPITVDGSSLEIQEIILPSGEVVQCYSSNVCNGTEQNQYYIIPNVGEQNSGGEREYNIVQTTDPLPVILQNLENAHLPLHQDQLIFITNSSEQVECTETEVTTIQVKENEQ